LRSLLLLILWALPLLGRADTVLVLGDSLSAAYGMAANQGWVQLLQQRLVSETPGYQVVNASISGDTTQGGLNRLPTLLQQHQPSVVIIELGGNDGLRGTPPVRIAQNLKQLVNLSKSRGAEVMLLGIRLPSNYGPAYNERFSSLYQQVSDETGAALVPFFMAQVALKPELMQADGLHPNAAAQPFLLDTVWPRLQPILKNVEENVAR